MKRPSEPEESWEELRRKVIGLGERSGRKSFYPELRARVEELRFLSDASLRLASSLDPAATVAAVRELVLPVLADWCAVYAREADGTLRRVSLACADPAKQEAAAALQRRYPVCEGQELGVAPAVATGRAELVAQVATDLIAASARDAGEAALWHVLAPRSLLIAPLVASGGTIGALLLATAESGRQLGARELALATQFAQRLASALENARLFHAAREANRLKDEFLAMVSHELRTPLTAILGWAELLHTRAVDPQRLAHGLETIERNAVSLTCIVEDLLEVTRMMAGKLTLAVAPMDLAGVIDAAVATLRPLAAAKDLGLSLELDRALPATAGDAARVQQVVWNLLSNAIKFTPAGGRVEVRLTRAGSQAELTVSDTGRGIDAALLPHIFEPFRQAEGVTHRARGGLGLGLAIVRRLVDLHYGTVRAESPGEGRGTRIVVALPLASGAAVAAPAPAATTSCDAPSLAGVRVLVVDDDTDTRELLLTILQSAGAEVVEAGSAREALTALSGRAPDVMISDLAMPETDGGALVREIRGRGWRFPCAAVTAMSRDSDRRQALADGFDRFLAKPIQGPDLVRLVAELTVARA